MTILVPLNHHFNKVLKTFFCCVLTVEIFFLFLYRFFFTGHCDGVGVFTYLCVIYFNVLLTIIIVLLSTKLE